MTKSRVFILGAVAGGLLALWYAPASGEEMREQISKKSEDILDELNDKIDEGKQVLTDLKRRAVLVKTRVGEALREELEEQRKDFKSNGRKHVVKGHHQ